jgi:hypothetical protein
MFAETSRACQIYHNVFTQLQLIRKLYGSFPLADYGLWHWKFYMFLVIEEDWEIEHIGASCLLGPLIRSILLLGLRLCYGYRSFSSVFESCSIFGLYYFIEGLFVIM